MKWLLMLSLIIAGCASKQKGETPAPAPGEAPSVAAFSARYDVQTLDNGLKIIWIRDDKLPVVSLALALRSGGKFDPAGQEGLAELTASLLDKGLPGKTALEIADRIEQRADAFGAHVDSDATWVGIGGLSFHDAESLQDFYDLVTRPTFPAQEVERERKLTIARLKHIVDRPGEFTSIVYERMLYGDHPYAHDGRGTPESIGHIKRPDIVEFHKQFYSPDRGTLAVVGRFDDAFKNTLVSLFSNWKKSGLQLATLPEPQPSPGFSILAVEKPELQQTEIRMGHIGVKRNIPDHIPLRVATAILGDPGSFTARLFSEIRVKRGLTYGIRAAFDQRNAPGPFVISTFTRNDKIHEMVGELLKVFKDFHDHGVTSDEVNLAKSALKNRFPHVIETGDDLAAQLLILDLNGVSFDYLKTFPEEIEKVTVAQVNDAIKEHFQPDNLKFVVFGPEGSKGLEGLKEFGPLTMESYKKAY